MTIPISTKEYLIDNINNILSVAIQNRLIIPFYQPIINNETNEIVKYEALMRIDYNDKILYPKDFLDYSLKNNFYMELSRLMLEKIFYDVSEYNINVSINLTMEDISDDITTSLIYSLLKTSKYPKNITFEIVEIFHIFNTEKFNIFSNEIKKYGSMLSIDDFGTGYSNFEYFSKFEFDFIKIDGLFIKDILDNEKHEKIVKSLSSLVEGTDIKLIAEYVENETIFEKIKTLKIHYSQGFLFGEAIPIEKVISRTCYINI